VIEPEINNVSIDDTWTAMTIFQSIKKMLRTLKSKFSSSPREPFTQDESGELMRRYMANQNWFDKISYIWTNQSFFQKTIYIIGITLLAGFIGLFIGSPIILAVFIGFIALTFHSLLVGHEQNRQANAKLFASEAITLNAELRESKRVFNEKIIELTQQVQSLQDNNATMSKHVSKLEEENEKITHQNEELIAQTNRLKEKESVLVAQQNAVEVKFKEIFNHSDNCSREISRTTEIVATIGKNGAELSEVVMNAKKSQLIFSQAVSSFRHTVNEQAKQKKNVLNEPNPSDGVLDRLKRDNKSDDELIKKLRLGSEISTDPSEKQIHKLLIGCGKIVI